jgi:hypothetical protein
VIGSDILINDDLIAETCTDEEYTLEDFMERYG